MSALLDDIGAEMRSALLDTVPSYSEYAPTVVLPDGKAKGGTLAPMPAQACILAALDAGARHIVILKPVQDGATTLAMVPLFRRAILEHQTVLLCYPTGDSAKDIWTTKAAPMLAEFGGQEFTTGGGSKGGAARVSTLPGGGRFMLRSGGGRGESGQASVSGDAMMVDELDDWENRRVTLNIRKRIKESPDPLLIEASTVKLDEGSLIIAAYEGGTKTHLEFPCPHCGALQRLVWGQVDLEACTYRCAHCPGVWTEAQRREALRHWKRVDENPAATTFSIRWTCLDSPMTSLREEIHGTIALPGYLSALRHVAIGEHEEMRSFYRDRLSQVYLDDLQDEEGEGQKVDVGYLADRSAALGWDRVVGDLHPDKLWSRYQCTDPQHAEAAVAIIDVQGDRLYWSVIAYNLRGSTWDLAWGQERCRMRRVGNELQPEPWGPGDLQETLTRTAEHIATTTGLPITHRGVDTRYEGRELAMWLRENSSWRGIAGYSTLPNLDPEAIERRRIMLPGLLGYDRRWLIGLGRWEIVTERARERVHNAYRKAASEPGAALLPAGLATNDHYLRHLCSWSLETDEKTKRTKWVQKQKRDDHLDCRSYAQALITFDVERDLAKKKKNA